jgi:mRNA interferase MazF
MICSPGDLVGIPFPFSDLSQKKKRPVLVITHPVQRGDFMCLAVTSVPTVQEAIVIDNKLMMTGNLPKPAGFVMINYLP